MNREADWTDLIPALNRILNERDDQIRVRVVYDWAFYDNLETEFKEFEKFSPYDKYIETLRSADIALLPLKPTRFNNCKSDLKYIECAAQGVAVLASPTVYGQTLRDGETGLLFHTPEEFEEKLNQLLDNANLRRKLVENAYNYVAENRMLAQHFRERHEWYKQLRDNLPELNRQVKERVPEMR